MLMLGHRRLDKKIMISLNDFIRHLFRSMNRAVIKSQLIEQLNSKKINSKTSAIRLTQLPPKPLIIHTGDGPYSGPTFNCKVLIPINDGRPSPTNDNTCLLKQPGISADGRCRCTYVVSDRDSDGCALGFLFTCLPK
ncbi:unnamed protein product [Cercopithifilaria johnstoni]|uniref:Uncharacterized protein n=1 Tax=Cercopithifilaria johnstoni TaxID=2874296 RepID=A0A8J2LVH4_9BILA|nr:unnamed protein product [Cercopithifilaria johnstoni]